MTVNTSALVKIYIGDSVSAAPANQGEYEATNFVEIGEVADLGEFGDRSNPITFTSLADRRVRKFKGSFDAGTLTLGLGRDISDSGQSALSTANGTDFDYTFKVEFNDGSAGSPSENSVQYFIGKVMSYTTNVGSADSIVGSTVEVGINSSILEVAAV